MAGIGSWVPVRVVGKRAVISAAICAPATPSTLVGVVCDAAVELVFHTEAFDGI